MVQLTERSKSRLMAFAGLALAAAVLFAAGVCPAATFAKPSASRGADKNYVTVKWSGVKKAKGYSVLRSIKKDIRFAQVIERTTSGTRKVKDRTAKLCTQYYYWVVPIVKGNGNGYLSSHSNKCARGWRKSKVEYRLSSYGTARKGRKNVLQVWVNGKNLSQTGVKWSMRTKGVHQWFGVAGAKGQIGFFASANKGKGAFILDLGESGDYEVKGTIVWY
ncbi:MAG: hypothetical protein IKE55_03085 [Kiritimatiellae bacterium]|nr:hypothetical protein [Kiritimatiellia bacterium]